VRLDGDTTEDRKNQIRSLLHAGGMAISLLAIGYVAWRASAAALEREFLTPSLVGIIVATGCAYAGLGLLIGLAWYFLLASTRTAQLPWHQALLIFGRSQLLKYLPSNLLH